LVDTLALICS